MEVMRLKPAPILLSLQKAGAGLNLQLFLQAQHEENP